MSTSQTIADEKCDSHANEDEDIQQEKAQVILSDSNTQTQPSSTVHVHVCGVDDANDCSEILSSAHNKTDRTTADCADDDDDQPDAAVATLASTTTTTPSPSIAAPMSNDASATTDNAQTDQKDSAQSDDDTSTKIVGKSAQQTTVEGGASPLATETDKNGGDEKNDKNAAEPKVTGKKRKREKTRWGPPPRKKRWGSKQSQPPNQSALIQNLLQISCQKQQSAAMANAMVGNAWNENQTKIFLLKNQLQDVSTRLIVPGAFAAMESAQPEAERSPSPEPVYDNKTGVRINTREYRMKEKLQQRRNHIIGELLSVDASYQAPPDYKAPKLTHTIFMPVDEFPDYNFFGLIVGPRGHTQKELQKETGCKIAVRGQGACLDKPNRMVHPDDHEPLHVHITAPNQDSLDRATRMIDALLQEVRTGGGQHKAKQLRELATINGTLRIEQRCRVCGGPHPIYSCPERQGEQWTPADIQCVICGELTHVTEDCKHFKKGKPLHLQSAAFSGGTRVSIDAEYDAFMSELIGDGGTASASSRPIAAITAPSMTTRCVTLTMPTLQHKPRIAANATAATTTAKVADAETEYHNVAPPSQSGARPPQEYEVTTVENGNGEDADTATTNTNNAEENKTDTAGNASGDGNSNGSSQVTVAAAPVIPPPAMNMAMPMMPPHPYAMGMMNPAAAAAMMAAPMYPGLMRPPYPMSMNPYAMPMQMPMQMQMPMAMPPQTYPYYGNPYFPSNPYSANNVPK